MPSQGRRAIGNRQSARRDDRCPCRCFVPPNTKRTLKALDELFTADGGRATDVAVGPIAEALGDVSEDNVKASLLWLADPCDHDPYIEIMGSSWQDSLIRVRALTPRGEAELAAGVADA